MFDKTLTPMFNRGAREWASKLFKGWTGKKMIRISGPIERAHVQSREALQPLLRYVWKHSPFYRELYESHGIRGRNISEITIRDLPPVSKQVLMENFDRVVTDPRLDLSSLESWIHKNPEPHKRYAGEF